MRELETEQNCNVLTLTLLAITTFLSRSPGLLNRGLGAQLLCGMFSFLHFLSNSSDHQTDWTSCALSYITVQRPPSSCGRQKSLLFNPSTVKVIFWYSLTWCPCYLHRCISYFDSLAGSEVNIQQQPRVEFSDIFPIHALISVHKVLCSNVAHYLTPWLSPQEYIYIY